MLLSLVQHYYVLLHVCVYRSLLVYNKAEGELQHYDSYSDHNLPAARALARKLSPALHGKRPSIKYVRTQSRGWGRGGGGGSEPKRLLIY